jgi:hypothetical protein
MQGSGGNSAGSEGGHTLEANDSWAGRKRERKQGQKKRKIFCLG